MEKPKISESEWRIMEVLWQASPQSANEIVKALEPTTSWSDRTIRTMISRLQKKGVLCREKREKEYFFTPAVSKDQCVVAETRNLLGRIGAAALKPMLAAFIDDQDLSKAEIEELRRILDKKGNGS